MNYLRGFIPWIVFAVMPSRDLKWAAALALLVGVAIFGRQRRKGVEADAMILEISTVVFFAALVALAYAVPNFSVLARYTGALSFAWLALTAWGSLAVRHPFTLGIARQSTPPEIWDRPQFMQVNVVITAVWAAAFTLTGAAVAVCVIAGAGTIASIACEAVGFVLPAIFTARYPRIVQARYANNGAAAR